MDPSQQPSSTLTPQAIAQALQAISALQKIRNPQSGGQLATVTQPPATPGMVGQVGSGGQTPMPNIPYSSAGAARQIAPPSQGRPQATQTPIPQLGSAYDTQAASKGAVAQSVVNSVIGIANQAKQKRQADESLKAENYFSQLMTAAQNPSDPNNAKIIQLLTSDPKVMKTIEKGLDYSFAQEPAAPKKPEPPEAKGLKAAVQKLFHGTPQPKTQPAAGQPGGIVLPGPTEAAKLQAAQQNAQLSGMQQSPELRQAQAGLRPTPVQEATLDANERIQAGHDFAKYQVELEKAQTAQKTADAAYQKQALANKGRFDATTSVARINAQARVESARIVAQASLMRAMGKPMKEPTVQIRDRWSAMQRAQNDMSLIMGGDNSNETYKQLLSNLRASGLSNVLLTIPGATGSQAGKMLSGVGSIFGKQTDQWKAAQSGLGSAVSSFKDSLQKTFPDWNLGASEKTKDNDSSDSGSLDDQIMNAISGGDESGGSSDSDSDNSDDK